MPSKILDMLSSVYFFSFIWYHSPLYFLSSSQVNTLSVSLQSTVSTFHIRVFAIFSPFAWGAFPQLCMVLFQIFSIQRGFSWLFCLKKDHLCYSPYQDHCYCPQRTIYTPCTFLLTWLLSISLLEFLREETLSISFLTISLESSSVPGN